MKLRPLFATFALLWISTILMVPTAQSSPETYGPRIDDLFGRFIVGPSAQLTALRTGTADIWFDIKDPDYVGIVQGAGFTVLSSEAFQFYYIAFNVRDQENPSGGGSPWRIGAGTPAYYTYWGAAYSGYVPLDEQAFRHACAHLVPKEEIALVVYGDRTAAFIDSTVPPTQAAWHNPQVDGHPYSRAEAISILETAGYVWEPLAPNPAPKHSPTDPDGNWLDPHTALPADDPLTPWDDTIGSPMNHITFVGLPAAFSPTCWAKDDICHREFRAIGLPIQHVTLALAALDGMMNTHTFDMYSLGWKLGRFPNHLCGFFHSTQDVINGYNTPGLRDPELDLLLDIIDGSWDRTVIREACLEAQEMIAEKLPYVVVVTGHSFAAFAEIGAPGHTDTLEGMVNSPGYGSENDWTFYDLHWASAITPGNPYGIGGTVNMIVGSPPTNYHPGYASTIDEWRVLNRIFDPLIHVDPYSHADIPWLATSWSIEEWTAPGDIPGMKTTFWLRDDIYWHDGVPYTAESAKWSLEFARDQQIARAAPMWQHLVDIEVHDDYTFSVYHNTTSLWTIYHIAGPDLWLVGDAPCWATVFPRHIYEGTGPFFRPEAIINPINPALTCLVGTGPFVYQGGNLVVGGFVHLSAYRSGPSPVTTQWFMSVEKEDASLTEMFHWVGDVNRDGIINIFDLSIACMAYGTSCGDQSYNPDADIAPEPTYHTNDCRIDIRDIAEICLNWGKQRKYP